MNTIDIMFAHDKDYASMIVRALIMVVSFFIVYVGRKRLIAEKRTEYAFAVILGACWLAFYSASIFFVGIDSGQPFAPEIVRPLILVTLTMVLAWLVRWCR